MFEPKNLFFVVAPDGQPVPPASALALHPVFGRGAPAASRAGCCRLRRLPAQCATACAWTIAPGQTEVGELHMVNKAGFYFLAGLRRSD